MLQPVDERHCSVGSCSFGDGRNVRKCEGFRTPARRPYPHAPTAGVRKAPMDEIARGGASTVRRALRGFDRHAYADEDGGTSSDAVAVLEPAGAHNPSLLAQILSK